MNEPVIFNSPEFGEIRVARIDEEPWFVGKDVALALGYSNTKDAISRHVDEEDKGGSRITTPSGIQEMTVINESGVYSLIFSSKLPSAKAFKRWVTAEVLPSIRRGGGYIKGRESMAPEELMAQALLVAQRTIEEQAAKLEALEVQNRTLLASLPWGPPVDSWSPSELSRMLACALEQGREDFITVLYLGYYLGLTPSECFAIETETAMRACEERTLTVRGRGKLPLKEVLIQRIRRHLALENPGRRLLIPDRRWMPQSVGAFQAFLALYWPYAQDKSRSVGHTKTPCLM